MASVRTSSTSTERRVASGCPPFMTCSSRFGQEQAMSTAARVSGAVPGAVGPLAANRQWLEQTLSGSELVRFTSVTLWAFLRIATNPRVFEHPLTVVEALDAVTSWLAQTVAAVIEPGERHWDLLREIASLGQATGPMVMDAVLAA